MYVYNFLKCNEGKVKNTEHIYLIYWNEISYLYLKRNIRFFYFESFFNKNQDYKICLGFII